MDNIKHIVGVDEAGRGAWAGPVYAAAVILDPKAPIVGLTDSKLLSPKQRACLFQEIVVKALAFGIASASVEEIDSMNILQATFLAMQRAVDKLNFSFDEIWVDGNQQPKWPHPTRCIIDGDRLVDAISAASILAKVSRDEDITTWDDKLPYGFAQHKGYGTALHQEKLAQYGVSMIHRRSFKPIKIRLMEPVNE